MGSAPSVKIHGMSSSCAIGLSALIVLGGLTLPAGADDQPTRSPPGRTAADPPSEGGRPDEAAPQPGVVVVPTADKGTDEQQLEAARAAARAAADRGDGKGGDGKNEDLERARAAARAADPGRPDPEKKRRDPADKGDGSGKDCMSARDARGAIVAKRVVTLAQALRTARDAWNGEVIDYKLCSFDGLLAYDLTLLSPDGRVARVRVGAADGKLVGVR